MRIKIFLLVTFILGVMVTIGWLALQKPAQPKHGIGVRAQVVQSQKSVRARVSGRGLAGAWFGLVTSTPVAVSEIFLPSSLLTEDGFATGEVVIKNDSNKSLLIPASASLTAKNGAVFLTNSSITVAPHTSVTIGVKALVPGSAGDLGPASFVLLDAHGSAMVGLSISSTETFSGGVIHVGALSDADKALAQAKLESALLHEGEIQLHPVIGGAVAAYTVATPMLTFGGPDPVSGAVVVHAEAEVVAVTYPETTGGQVVTIDEYNIPDQTATIIITPGSSGGHSGSPPGVVPDPAPTQDLTPPPPPGQVSDFFEQPEEQAIAACHNKSSGTPCSFATPQYEFTGSCSNITAGILECVTDTR